MNRRCHRLLGSASVLMAAAFAIPTHALAQQAQADASASAEADENEIIVTARKIEERLLDVPVPISVIPAEALQETNQTDLRQYFARVPSVGITLGNSGAPTIAIRGVTTGGFSTPTVATLIDDIPYGGSSLFASGFATPEVDASDLASIEILRGPQGTLYGASTLGGLLKFRTIAPSLDELSGRVQVSASRVAHSDDWGHAVRGAVNVPLSDRVALRASGYWRREAGWIDNVRTGAEDINDIEYMGGRLALLWQATDDISVTLSAAHQERDIGASAYVEEAVGPYAQNTLPDTGWVRQELQAYSMTIRANVGNAQITSLTGYNHNRFDDRYDYSRVYLPIAVGTPAAPGPFPTAGGVTLEEHVNTKKFSQELRVGLPVSRDIDLLVGAFYTNENSTVPQAITAVTAQAVPIGLISQNLPVSSYSEVALFANATIRFTDRFDVQLGARYGVIDQQLAITYTGLFPRTVAPVTTQDKPFTYLIAPRYRFTDDFMIYGRLATGYRPGGPNSPGATGILPPFDPDTTTNYELGVKGELLGGAATVDLSLFNIEWDDILVQGILDSSGFYNNGKGARSRGVEFSSTVRPVRGWEISGWVTYTDAELTEDFPAGTILFGRAGDRLPVSPRWSWNISSEFETPVSSNVTAFAGGSLTYVGDRIGLFVRQTNPAVIPPRQLLPHYTQLDLRAGVRIGDLTATVYVNNLTDEKGLLRGGLGYTFPFARYYTQPRTIGLTVGYAF